MQYYPPTAYAEQVPGPAAAAAAEESQRAQRLDVHGNEHTMNLPPSVHLNIQQSAVFKGL